MLHRNAPRTAPWLSAILICFQTVSVGLGDTAPDAKNDDQAFRILEDTGIQGGVIVHLGCGDGSLTGALRVNDRFLVHGLETDSASVRRARENILKRRRYGQVSVAAFDGKRLPYADNMVNLLVASRPERVGMAEVMRVLVPGGVAYVDTGGSWEKTVKPWPAEMGQWSHYLHGANGNPVTEERLAVLNAATGEIVWVTTEEYAGTAKETGRLKVQKQTVLNTAASGDSVCFLDGAEIVCLDRLTGKARWRARPPTKGSELWVGTLIIHSGVVLYAEQGILTALSVEDGAQLWTRQAKQPGGGEPMWSRRVPIRVTAMAVTPDRLLIAGSADIVDRADPLASFEARQGGRLRLVSTDDGGNLDEYELDSPPVFHGLAVARGRVFISLESGKVMCLAAAGK